MLKEKLAGADLDVAVVEIDNKAQEIAGKKTDQAAVVDINALEEFDLEDIEVIESKVFA